jgi:F0F1-type ATP synthase assembly protein I
MKTIDHLNYEIDRLESRHRFFIEFGAKVLMGMLATVFFIDHYNSQWLWLLLIGLIVTFITIVVSAVKSDLKKDTYTNELNKRKAVISNGDQK